MRLPIALLCLSCTAGHAQDVEDWITRYEDRIQYYEAQPKPPPGGMVITGNSNIVVWTWSKPSMQEMLEPLPVVPRGFGGSTTEELHHYLDRLVLSTDPASVVICEGENDFGMGFDAAHIAERHADIMRRIHAFDPGIRLYVIGLKPSPQRWSQWETFQATNRLLEGICDATPLCTYIPPPAGLLGADGKPIASLYSDALHLNGEGYAVWTAAIRPVLIDGEQRAARVPKAPAEFRATER